MSTPGARLLRRKRGTRRPTPRPRPRIVKVTSHWTVHPDGNLRTVLVRHPDGSLEHRGLPDSHPALVRFLERAHAVAVAA